MGHRAVIAYQRPGGLYNLHYSHWGAQNLQLDHEITGLTPFGGQAPKEWSQSTYEALIGGDRERYETLLNADERPATAVRPEPMATAISFEDIIAERLDYRRYEAFFVVTTDFEVTSYRALWFGLDDYCERAMCSPTTGNGAFVPVRWYDGEPVDDACVRSRFEAMKDVVGDMVDRNVFTLEEADEYLQTKLAAHVDRSGDLIIRTPDETVATL